MITICRFKHLTVEVYESWNGQINVIVKDEHKAKVAYSAWPDVPNLVGRLKSIELLIEYDRLDEAQKLVDDLRRDGDEFGELARLQAILDQIDILSEDNDGLDDDE